jgi:hypothetical protein
MLVTVKAIIGGVGAMLLVGGTIGTGWKVPIIGLMVAAAGDIELALRMTLNILPGVALAVRRALFDPGLIGRNTTETSQPVM